MYQPMKATLPLYDLPEISHQTDALWTELANSFREVGFDEVPEKLDRSHQPYNAGLFFGQICGYPLTHEFSNRFQIIATPSYHTAYFRGAEYCSLIIVHKNCEWRSLEDARDSVAVINSIDSHSGYNILRFMVSELTQEKPFFRNIHISGAHKNSILSVSNKSSDIAAIDSVTWSLLDKHSPEALENCRILAVSPAAPSPVFVTESGRSETEIELFRTALKSTINQEKLKTIKADLFLEDIEILSENAYDKIIQIATNCKKHL